MLIRALTRACGRLNFAPDDIVDLDRSDALELIAAGAAVRASEEPEESVVDADVEQPKASKPKKG